MPKSHTKPRKLIPTFRSEDEERAFWATADTSEYFDYPQVLGGAHCGRTACERITFRCCRQRRFRCAV